MTLLLRSAGFVTVVRERHASLYNFPRPGAGSARFRSPPLSRKALSAHGFDPYARGALLVACALTLARLVALFGTRLELYPDEAQYWIWSRHLDWGYFSKPPMVAWAIRATTAIGGDAEPWVRLSAPLFHLGATLAIFAAGRRLYAPAVGFAAAGLYALTPAIQLSALVAATDAPLLFFLSVSLWAYAALQQSDRKAGWAALLGASLGLALLSKYAGAYALAGIGLHLSLSRSARAAWTPPASLGAIGACAACLAPNLAWNIAHGFQTFEHTAANAALGAHGAIHPPGLAQFLASQFGLVGPIPFAVLAGGAVVMAWRGRLTEADRLLLAFALPPLIAVSLVALLSRANANWAAAGWPSGLILAAAWLTRWRARRWLAAAVAIQALAAAVFLACVLDARIAENLGLANAFKRAKGWNATVQAVIERAERERGLTAIAVNDRFLFSAAGYYGRDYFAAANSPPLRMWLKAARPMSQAEATAPLTRAEGGRVLAASLGLVYRDEMAADFARVSGREILGVSLDRRHRLRTETFIGEGFDPKPR